MSSYISRLIIVALATGICIGVAYYFLSKPKNVPVIQPSKVNPILVDESVRGAKDHRVAHFALHDQEGNITDSTFTAGKLHVADFFFTTCQTICPIMSGKMDDLAQRFDPEDDDIRFLSFSVLPEEDSVAVLHDYAQAYGVRYAQWRLLTGSRADIYALARKSYFTLKPAEVGEGDGGTSDFIHTNNFVLVDEQGRIRGYFDGTSDFDIDRLEHVIRNLLDDRSAE